MNETTKIQIQPPWEVRLSPKIIGRYGYKDGHVELEVEVTLAPGPLSKLVKPFLYKQSFSADEAKMLKDALDKAVSWSELPDYQRQRDGAP